MQVHPEFHVSLLEPTRNNQINENDEASDEYEVEAIIDKRVDPQGRTEYLVKWQGYEDCDNTWEAVTNLFCPERIQEFEQVTGRRVAKKRKN
jgi:chromodomain-containing protein